MATTIESRFNAKLGQQQQVDISPTLIIGLGGSGKKVCERLRRLFFTKYREPGLPVVDYLYIDTDPKDAAGREGWDVIQEEIKFKAEDMVDVDIESEEVSRIFDNCNQHQHIFDWFHPSLKVLGTSLCTDGAGQIRSVGRLAFFHHYTRIREKVKAKLDRITNGIAINKINNNAEGKYNFQVDGRACNVFIVGSLAGGTGSGMFLDMAFLLKHIRPSLSPIGLFFLPSLFSHIGDDDELGAIRANGYAALMELDYMLAPSVGIQQQNDNFPTFNFNWDGRGEKTVSGPPFSNVYLLDGTNNSGLQTADDPVSGKDKEAYQMAAEFLFLDFKQSTFATSKRSVRANLRQYLVNETTFKTVDENGVTNYKEYFPNRYSSFGLSFIKLNSARKKHATAYFLGKSLASFWTQSQKFNNADIENEVNLALKIPTQNQEAHNFYGRNCDKQWDVATIKEYFLLKQDEGQTNMLKQHLDVVTEDFKALESSIEASHNLNTGGSVDEVFEAMEKFHSELSEKVKKIWLNHLDNIGIALGYSKNDATDALDEELISSNANMCYDLINQGLHDRVIDLISHPHAKGVAWAEKFIDVASKRLTHIAKGFTPENLPEGTCSFKVPQFADNNNIATTKQHLEEAQAIRFPPFRKAATCELKSLLRPNQESEIRARKKALLDALGETRKYLQRWYELKYEHFIREKADNIINRLQESLSKTEISDQGTTNESEEVSGLKGDLDLYKGGLGHLQAEREQLFKAIDKDSRDIKTINIHSETSGDWYIDQLRAVLHAKAADDWATILTKQSETFFIYLGNRNNRVCNHSYLLDVCRRWETGGNDWVSLSKALNTFCFNQVARFMTQESADDQFQTALQRNSEKYTNKLLNVAKRADAWVPPSAFVNAGGIPRTIIGVTDAAQSPTANLVQMQVEVFANIQPEQHENEEIVFYRELGAFPLFRVGSLADYAKDYFNTSGDDIYKRHTDYARYSKLRDILPPAGDAQIKAINTMGKLFLEALIMRCFESEKGKDGEGNELRFDPIAKGPSPLYPINIGQEFQREAKFFTELYRSALEARIKAQKTRLISGSRDATFEMLSVLNEYRARIYPTEMRGSNSGRRDAQEGFMQIVVSGLYRDYYAECADEVSQGGEYTDAEIENTIVDRMEQVDLKRVSMEFPYRESHAKQDALVLKMPEERS